MFCMPEQLQPEQSEQTTASLWRACAAAAGTMSAEDMSVPDVQCARAAAARAGDQAAQHRRLSVTHVRLLAGLSIAEPFHATSATAASRVHLPCP